jgi:hypothetical protein
MQRAPLQMLSGARSCTVYCTISVTTSDCGAPDTSVAVTEISDVPNGVAGVSVTEADPDAPATAAAVTVMVAGLGTTAGGVYNPAVLIIPLASPPVTAQVTVWSAVNCC